MNSNNRFLLLLGEFKWDQIFVKKNKTYKQFVCAKPESTLMN